MQLEVQVKKQKVSFAFASCLTLLCHRPPRPPPDPQVPSLKFQRTGLEPVTGAPAWALSRGIEMAKTENRKPAGNLGVIAIA